MAARAGCRHAGGRPVTAAQRQVTGPTRSIFERVLAGVDGSAESGEACRRAARLCRVQGVLEVFSAVAGRGAVESLVSASAGVPLLLLGCNDPRRAISLRSLPRELIRNAGSSVLVVR